jgi:hypothetical protein
MSFIPVINNYTGDEGQVDATWLARWPDDFTPLDDAAPVAFESPSTGTPDKEK